MWYRYVKNVVQFIHSLFIVHSQVLNGVDHKIILDTHPTSTMIVGWWESNYMYYDSEYGKGNAY